MVTRSSHHQDRETLEACEALLAPVSFSFHSISFFNLADGSLGGTRLHPAQAIRQGGHHALAALHVLVLVRVSPEPRSTSGSAGKVGPGRSICGPPVDSLVDDECASVSRLLSVCTCTHEGTYICRQAAQRNVTEGGAYPASFPRKGRRGLSPAIPPIVVKALKRLCADHQDCLVGSVSPAGSSPPSPSDLHPIRRYATASLPVSPVFAVRCGMGQGGP